MLKIGQTDNCGNKVVEISKKEFVVSCSDRYLRPMRLEAMGKSFFLKNGKWFLRYPLDSQFIGRFK